MPVRVVRGRAETPVADRARTTALVEHARDRRQPGVRVWTPHRQVAFGRRDAREDGYERARALCREHGFAPVERSVGGRAVAYTGTTIAFARVEPIADARTGLDSRYEAVTTAITNALDDLGVTAHRGEPPASFCPGAHSLSVDGKIVGIAQRVRKDVAMTSGIAITTDEAEIAAVLADVYEALGVAFDPESVGHIGRAAAEPRSVDQIQRAFEAALVDGRRREIVRV
jgi:lipoate-protein ligase A